MVLRVDRLKILLQLPIFSLPTCRKLGKYSLLGEIEFKIVIPNFYVIFLTMHSSFLMAGRTNCLSCRNTMWSNWPDQFCVFSNLLFACNDLQAFLYMAAMVFEMRAVHLYCFPPYSARMHSHASRRYASRKEYSFLLI